MRDGFNKSRRKQKSQSGDAVRAVKEYKYARALSFLTPFLCDRPTSSNYTEGSDEDSLQPDNFTDEDEDASLSVTFGQLPDYQPGRDHSDPPLNTSVSSSSQSTSKRKQKRTQDDSDDTLSCSYLKKSRTSGKREEKRDDVDLFLQSMATTIRKLPARTRAEVKFKIHSIVHEAEMQFCFPDPDLK